MAGTLLHAGVLTPGTNIPATAGPLTPGAIVGGPLVVNHSGTTGLLVDLTTTVWSGVAENPYPGGYTFTYELAVVGGSALNHLSSSIVNYGGGIPQIDAYWANPATVGGADEIDWAADASRLHLLNDIAIGATETLVVHTSATAFTQGTFGVTQGVADNTLVPVPEPHEYALIAGLGLFGFVAYRRMRA